MEKKTKMFTKPTQKTLKTSLKTVLSIAAGAGLSKGFTYLIGKFDKNGKLDDILVKGLVSSAGILVSSASTNPEVQKIGAGIAGVQILDLVSDVAKPVLPTGTSTAEEFIQSVFGLKGYIPANNRALGLGNPFKNAIVDWTEEETPIQEEAIQLEEQAPNWFR